MTSQRCVTSLERKIRRFSGDGLFESLSAGFAMSVVVVIVASVIVLVRGALPVLEKFGISFVTGVNWNPIAGREVFGALPYILGTLVTSVIAVAVGVPVSLGIAVFLAEMAPGLIRGPVSRLVELLAAVPSVIYGLWGLFVFRFWVRDLIETPISNSLGSIPIFHGAPTGSDILAGGLILAIMIIPTVSSVSREVMAAVPSVQREAAYSLGATRWEAIRIGVLSYSRSGILGAAILGLGRAVGETMAVTMVIGNAIGPAALPTSLFNNGQTMASLIANEFNEADPTSLHPSALIGIGLVLFGFALVINIFAQLLVWKVIRVKGGAVE